MSPFLIGPHFAAIEHSVFTPKARHNCLSKEQRDEHIRRYAELLEKQRAEAKVISPQNAAQLPPAPVGRPKSVAREIPDATGFNGDRVRNVRNQPWRMAARAAPSTKPVLPAPAS